MANSKVNVLIHSRKFARMTVTKLFNDRASFPNLDELNKQNKILKFNELISYLKQVDSQISQEKFGEDNFSEDELSEELRVCESYLDKARECLCLLTSSVAGQLPPQADAGTRCALRPPVAPLPEFNSGDGENLELFLSNFEATVLKYNYTDYDKYLLLKQQIKGKAALLLESLDPSAHTYNDAKDLLTSAFAGNSLQKFNIIKKLSELKLASDDEPFEYISDIRKIKQSFEKLQINVEDILQCFIFDGLNELFKAQLIQITNNVRPTLKEITDNFFKANELYQTARNLKIKKGQYIDRKEKSTVYAVAATKPKPNLNNKSVEVSNLNPFVTCPLCADVGLNCKHPINKCSKYPDSNSKIKRLAELNGCTICARVNHSDNDCKFKFKRSCHKCSAWHFSFLCPKVTNDTLRTKSQSSMVYNVLHNSIDNISVLPTFSVVLNDGREVRGLKDSGSQSSLVSEKILNKNNHEIIASNLELDLNGINNSKTYRSSLVRLKLKFPDGVKYIEALTIPSINITLHLPELSKIVRKFSEAGYKLADSFLLKYEDSIEDLGIVLGASASYCFLDRMIPFGERSQSVFSISPHGVMLYGNVSRLIEDVEYLPQCDNPRNSHSNKVSSVINYSAVNLGYKLKSCNYLSGVDCAINLSDKVNENVLEVKVDKALSEVDKRCDFYLHKEEVCREEDSEINSKLVEHLLENTTRNNDGRLVMPLLWNGRVSHLLASKF